MRTLSGRDEVLVVTYANGEIERFPDADEVQENRDRATVAVKAGLNRTLAHLVLVNVRKWEWVEV